MSSYEDKLYKKNWMAQHRADKQKRILISQGKCPISEILLTSYYHDKNCPCGLHTILPQNSDESQSVL